ncbi:MAG: dihydrofolate reductase [Candidatus Ancillula sp.]|jgi:dihydrofolate reductase|nr:dihydrofolate reductase [Candidatus Ancillula sp.]
MIEIAAIWCQDRDKLLGKKGDCELLWHLKEDFDFFRRVTSDPTARGNHVVMGVETYRSLPKRPLPKRLNWILCFPDERRALETEFAGDLAGKNLRICTSLSEVSEYIATRAVSVSDVDKVFIIGGASVYNWAVTTNQVQKVYVTEIDYSFAQDTELSVYVYAPELAMNTDYMPISSTEWMFSESDLTPTGEKIKYRFCQYALKAHPKCSQ